MEYHMLEARAQGRGRRLAAGAIAGIAIAGFVVFVAFLLCCYCCCFRKKRARNQEKVHYGGPPMAHQNGGGGFMGKLNGMMGRRRGPDYGVQQPAPAHYR
ncbi:uncharacterized protein PpBr36_10679 [Pyricularia pennisetigena]|uniref:uncharacterized protein n=2 Tax=Pyricularia pennisetigena TaxID=1578925 RepID=UPI00115245D1|nr:uncharacterized protein PpBr36_10679 [Pyricularia pennisetigena]TLS20947.1 hypothetical protein PpBr36_10679 [Pyricularia pennisetigena]